MTRIDGAWLRAPAARAVMGALGEAWFVGGCVRNALLGAEPGDIDLATPLVPDEVVRRLETAGLKAVPTGIEHGTVTAVAHGQGIEVTTFRADIEADGRRAVVRFSADMAEDAARRDFTMNALYADADGLVVDPLGGLPDLEARRVRFIGDAEERIAEDYLRILRFFRFHAWYGRGDLDRVGLAACAALRDGLDRLARERVTAEIRKLLAAPNPVAAVQAMAGAGVLSKCLPGAEPWRVSGLIAAERVTQVSPDWRTRFAVMRADGAGLRLSRAEERYLRRVGEALATRPGVAVLAYREGAEVARVLALDSLAERMGGASEAQSPEAQSPAAQSPEAQSPEAQWAAMEREIGIAAQARFPLAAADLIAIGYRPGRSLGEALAQSEQAWIDSGFRLDKDALLREYSQKGQYS